LKGARDIYLRAHTVQLEKQQPKHQSRFELPKKWPDYVLVFDCESDLSADQGLTFGSWRFCELRGVEYVCVDVVLEHREDPVFLVLFNQKLVCRRVP
jgi:hypothetical protein